MDPSESDLDLSEKQEETSSTPQPLKSRLLPKKRRMSYLSEDDQPVSLYYVWTIDNFTL